MSNDMINNDVLNIFLVWHPNIQFSMNIKVYDLIIVHFYPRKAVCNTMREITISYLSFGDKINIIVCLQCHFDKVQQHFGESFVQLKQKNKSELIKNRQFISEMFVCNTFGNSYKPSRDIFTRSFTPNRSSAAVNDIFIRDCVRQNEPIDVTRLCRVSFDIHIQLNILSHVRVKMKCGSCKEN